MKTKAVVLCPGPSLKEFAGRNGYGLVIGVNRAGNVEKCDYLVALDPHTPGWCDLRHRPTLVCARTVRDEAILDCEAVKHLPFLELSKDWLGPGAPKWWTKSLTTALVLAFVKGADAIDCYGVDWQGIEDFDGFTDARQKRGRERWKKEIRLVRDICKELLDRNVRIAGIPIPEAKKRGK